MTMSNSIIAAACHIPLSPCHGGLGLNTDAAIDELQPNPAMGYREQLDKSPSHWQKRRANRLFPSHHHP